MDVHHTENWTRDLLGFSWGFRCELGTNAWNMWSMRVDAFVKKQDSRAEVGILYLKKKDLAREPEGGMMKHTENVGHVQ